MCGMHRSNVISEIKSRLNRNEGTRVISTQLVEAGVDMDFPVVYRALAGLDSIVQAAGRCNREGRMESEGTVRVFVPERMAPPGYLRKALETTLGILKSSMLREIDNSVFERYFRELYWKVNNLDKAGIEDLLDPTKNDRSECSIYFRTASDLFRLIDDRGQKQIFVRYQHGNELIDRIKEHGPDRIIMRKLQRYVVNVSINEFNKLRLSGAVEEIHPSMYALSSELYYSEEFGLLLDESEIDTSKFIN
jgi:CRISPR-associated endonuclease/helicase Cas3